MTKLAWTTFSGIRPQVDERLLPDGSAQVADNINTERGGLRPMRGLRSVFSLVRNNPKTIYRFGQALASETQYWFSWLDDVDVVKGPIEDDTSERTYWTGDGVPKYTTAAIGTSGSNLPSGARPLGVAGPGNTPLLTATGTAPENAGTETRVYVYTLVSDNGEESIPSSPGTINILAGQGVIVAGLETSSSNGSVLATKRIYRAQQGVYLFVAEIPSTQQSFTDTVASAALGEPCPSVDWDLPSPTMKGLIGGPNGMMAAFDGYTVRFAEPFRPHAWPQAYSQTVGYPVVGIGHFGQSFVVVTTGLPYVMTGTDPANVSVAPGKFYQPCVSKRSVVNTGGDVVWASPDGLVSLGESGELNLTDGIFTPEQWLARKPETIVGEWHEGWYVGFYNPGSGVRGFMLRYSTKEWVDLPSLAATAMYRDTVSDALYLAVGTQIMKFKAGDLMPFSWKSQEVLSPLSGFTAARVTGTYPITFTFFRDQVLRMTKVVTSDEPFKLPSPLGRQWAVGVAGTGVVLGVAISTSETDI